MRVVAGEIDPRRFGRGKHLALYLIRLSGVFRTQRRLQLAQTNLRFAPPGALEEVAVVLVIFLRGTLGLVEGSPHARGELGTEFLYRFIHLSKVAQRAGAIRRTNGTIGALSQNALPVRFLRQTDSEAALEALSTEVR